MNAQQFWNIDNVYSFQGHDVRGGEIDMCNSAYRDMLNEIYGDVEVCGQTFGSGRLLEDADPVAFRCGKAEEEERLQRELEEQLNSEDSSGIEFIDGDEFELEEDEE